MILNANNIFTLRYGQFSSVIASDTYTEILEYAQETANSTGLTVSIYCLGTDSIFSTITPDSVAIAA